MDVAETVLLDLLAQAVQRGEFVLASGARSDYYLDARRVTLTPRGAALSGMIFYALARDLGANLIAGPATAAIPLIASAVATAYHGGEPLSGAYVRLGAKDHGTRRCVEGVVPEDARALLVDDVGTSGRSLARAGEVLLNEYPTVKIVGSSVLVDRAAGAAGNLACLGPYRPVFGIDQVLKAVG